MTHCQMNIFAKQFSLGFGNKLHLSIVSLIDVGLAALAAVRIALSVTFSANALIFVETVVLALAKTTRKCVKAMSFAPAV